MCFTYLYALIWTKKCVNETNKIITFLQLPIKLSRRAEYECQMMEGRIWGSEARGLICGLGSDMRSGGWIYQNPWRKDCTVIFLVGPLMRVGLSLIKNVLTPLAKSVLSRLTAVASVTDTFIQKKIFESEMTTLMISNEEMNDTVKIVKSLEESSFLIKGVNGTIKNESEEWKGGLLSIF